MRSIAFLIGGLIVGALAMYLYPGAGAPEGGEQAAQTAAPDEAGQPAAPDAAAQPAGERKVRWKLASAYSSELPIIGELIARFIDNLAVMSGGDIEIRYFEPNALVPPLEIFDAVSQGSVDAGYATPGF